jgi:hypothetical protein
MQRCNGPELFLDENNIRKYFVLCINLTRSISPDEVERKHNL